MGYKTMSNIIYAIGDIHGEITKLRKLYNKILGDIKFHGHRNIAIVFLGDYIDRGEDSKAVLDFLMQLKDTVNLKHVFLFGNHEEFMIHAWNHPNSEMTRVWLMNGGMKCIYDFGYEFTYSEEPLMDEKMQPYIDWLMNKTVLIHQEGKYVFVHAGFDCDHPLDKQRSEVLLWSRGQSYTDAPYTVVHGHTIVKEPLDAHNEINVDTGSFTNDGKLTAVKLFPEDTSFREFLMVK
jgi:serine/threonine protein phosphatase 1